MGMARAEASVLDTVKDIHSMGDFKRDTTEFLKQMRQTGQALVLTIGGKPQLVIQDAASYQKLLDRIDELEALEGIKRGLADVKAGRVTPLKDFERKFRKKHGIPRRSR